ncbi:hypothetical protein ACSBR2_023199 [Camellia fascicularis]
MRVDRVSYGTILVRGRSRGNRLETLASFIHSKTKSFEDLNGISTTLNPIHCSSRFRSRAPVTGIGALRSYKE